MHACEGDRILLLTSKMVGVSTQSIVLRFQVHSITRMVKDESLLDFNLIMDNDLVAKGQFSLCYHHSILTPRVSAFVIVTLLLAFIIVLLSRITYSCTNVSRIGKLRTLPTSYMMIDYIGIGQDLFFIPSFYPNRSDPK